MKRFSDFFKLFTKSISFKMSPCIIIFTSFWEEKVMSTWGWALNAHQFFFHKKTCLTFANYPSIYLTFKHFLKIVYEHLNCCHHIEENHFMILKPLIPLKKKKRNCFHNIIPCNFIGEKDARLLNHLHLQRPWSFQLQ